MKIVMLQSRLSWIAMTLGGLCLGVEASSHSLRKVPLDATFHSEQKKVLADDQQFWGEMASGTEVELNRMVALLSRNRRKGHVVSGLAQLGSHKSVASPNADIGLEPMAGMLDNLYEESKKRIAKLNQRESKSKQTFSEHQQEDRGRIAQIEAEFQVHHASGALQATDDALKVHLEDEEHGFMKYWDRVRARNHKQFHTYLKIQHGLMDRLKSMRTAYHQAATEGGSAEAVPPEVAAAALLQHQTHQSFVKESLRAVAEQRAVAASWSLSTAEPVGEGAHQSHDAVKERTTDKNTHCEDGKWGDCYRHDYIDKRGSPPPQKAPTAPQRSGAAQVTLVGVVAIAVATALAC